MMFHFQLFPTYVINCVDSLVVKGEDKEIRPAVAVSNETCGSVGY